MGSTVTWLGKRRHRMLRSQESQPEGSLSTAERGPQAPCASHTSSSPCPVLSSQHTTHRWPWGSTAASGQSSEQGHLKAERMVMTDSPKWMRTHWVLTTSLAPIHTHLHCLAQGETLFMELIHHLWLEPPHAPPPTLPKSPAPTTA